MNGVMMGPNQPVSPAIPMAAVTAMASPARKGPMSGTGAGAAATASPMPTTIAAVPGPKARLGTPWTMPSTFHTPPTTDTDSPRSTVARTKSPNDTGTETVGHVMSIRGVQTVPTHGMSMQTWGMWISGRKSPRSSDSVALALQ